MLFTAIALNAGLVFPNRFFATLINPRLQKATYTDSRCDPQILFYEDQKSIQDMQNKHVLYADKVPQWADHTSGMHQYFVLTALEAEGLGANLQHYNHLCDQKVSEVWNVPLTWQLKGQLVFGTPAAGVREKLSEKVQQPIEQRLFVHGA